MTLWYALIDLLPFQWAEPGKMYFMKNALLAILVISPLFGLLSTMVVEKRMAFFSDALGHSAFTGVAIGTLCGLVDATWCAVALAVVFALLFTWVQSRTRMASDTVIGVFSSTAVALGIFISTLDGHSFTKFNSLLIGDILSVSPAKIAILALILLLVMVFWVLRINRLTLTATYPVLAVSRGVQVNLLDALFNCAIAVVVTLSLTWVGLLVINSLLVLPGAAARNVAKNMRQYTWLALLGAVVSGIAGLEPYTVQNWVKRGFLQPPRGKRYDMEQVCRILNINLLKGALTLEQSCQLISYINGDLTDESDDLIDDTLLYFYFVRLAARAQDLGNKDVWDVALKEVTASYREPIPGAGEKLEKVLKVMLTAWLAGRLKAQAEQMLGELTIKKGE